jgi:2-methylcitrate dehydratase PrpD
VKYTNRFLDFITDFTYKDIPKDVITKCKHCLLDVIGVSIAGSFTKAASIAKQLTYSHFGLGDVTVYGEHQKSTCLGATWANSIMASALDLDDGHSKAVGHPGAVIIPGVIALAESRNISGRDLILAIVIGYEASLRIAASRQPSYIHTYATGPWGVYGAGIAAAKLLGLDREGVAHAIGLAGTHGPARPHSKNYEFVPMVKEAIGWAAVTGVSSALLAEHGFTGFVDFLDYDEFFDGELLVGTLGKEFEIRDVWFKPYSACRWSHSSIDAVCQLRNKHNIRPDEVVEIKIHTFERASLMGTKRPVTEETAQYSIPYNVAVAICDGESGPMQLLKKRNTDIDVLKLAEKVTLVYNDEMEKAFPRNMGAIVEVITNRGIFSARVDSPKGDPSNPFTLEEIEQKFEGLTLPYLNIETVEALKKKILEIDELQDITEITDYLKFDIKK